MRNNHMKMLALLVLVTTVLMGAVPSSLARAALQVHHDLTIELDPRQHLLTGRDRITLSGRTGERAEFTLSPRMTLDAVTSRGRKLSHRFSDGVLSVDLPPSDGETVAITVVYHGVLKDPAPERPLNTDNPGYGVSATIVPRGTLLLGGAFWYPRHENDDTMVLDVSAPEGYLAVTSGDLIGHTSKDGRTLSRWRIRHMVEPPALTAGPLKRQSLSDSGTVMATYFSEPRQSLSPVYLESGSRFLSEFEALFGPYPFGQFAVVENFFPTGYGFPGFTLIGGRVLQLPFIPHTSLGHEIAHCWWGNGVLVSYEQGNWCEGLTTYVAEHRMQEKKSLQSARAYRIQWLRNYAAVVDDANEIPLSRFTSRLDPVTKTIGYDKSAMVFHMLRETVGDAVFWQCLRDMFARRLFKPTAWRHWQQVFEKGSGMPLDTFFEQWVNRPGAPVLALGQVRTQRTHSGYRIEGRLDQKKPFFDLNVPVLLETENGSVTKVVKLSAGRADFSLTSTAAPRVLEVDPMVDLFRRLAPEELPATVNQLKGADFLEPAADVPDEPWSRELMRILKVSLGLTFENNAGGGESAQLRIIRPEQPVDLAELPIRVTATQASLQVEDQRFSRADTSFFAVFEGCGGLTAIFIPAADPNAAAADAAKITHYGKYSYLVFENSRNRLKGTWQTKRSPLVYRWQTKESAP